MTGEPAKARRAGGHAARKTLKRRRASERPVHAGFTNGQYRALTDDDMERIHR
ncbi:MAG: hypothetical protein IH999_11575 [Proteobacteria bacterium]|nr:hypothetical protein [Pseudomonadota bacterium]